MDYIIYRQNYNEFMRWDDGSIFVTADEDEIKEEFEKEVADNTNPLILTLNYSTYFDSEYNEICLVRIKDERGADMGVFGYNAHFDDEDDFYKELDNWAKDFQVKSV